MPDNRGAILAHINKCDEFFSAYEDVEKEMSLYDFNGKSVYCNADGMDSSFYRYFACNFAKLGLKRLVCTCIEGIKIEVGEDISVTPLLDGDFRSRECLEELEKADVVVTNPPFSLFREFLRTMVECDKEFILLGNVNAVTNDYVLGLIKDGKLRLGDTIHSGDRKFYVPDSYPLSAAGSGRDENGRFIRVKGVRWFTNIGKNNGGPIEIANEFDPERYPHYDDVDAVNVDRVSDIPNYSGMMGVPITFIDRWCPEQFEILDGRNYGGKQMCVSPKLNGRKLYRRLLIRKIPNFREEEDE